MRSGRTGTPNERIVMKVREVLAIADKLNMEMVNDNIIALTYYYPHREMYIRISMYYLEEMDAKHLEQMINGEKEFEIKFASDVTSDIMKCVRNK